MREVLAGQAGVVSTGLWWLRKCSLSAFAAVRPCRYQRLLSHQSRRSYKRSEVGMSQPYSVIRGCAADCAFKKGTTRKVTTR